MRKVEEHNNQWLNEILFDQGYDTFDEFSKEMLDMTSKNIFK